MSMAEIVVFKLQEEKEKLDKMLERMEAYKDQTPPCADRDRLEVAMGHLSSTIDAMVEFT